MNWRYFFNFPYRWKQWILYRFHPKHRYHIINTGLSPGWHDRDYLMQHIMIKLLVDFIEREKPFEHFDIENSHNKDKWYELKELYIFFKDIWNEHDSIDFGYYQDNYAELTKKLCRLVELRGLMWT